MEVVVKILKQKFTVGRSRMAMQTSNEVGCSTIKNVLDKQTVANSTSDIDKFTMKKSWLDLFTFRFTTSITNALPMTEGNNDEGNNSDCQFDWIDLKSKCNTNSWHGRTKDIVHFHRMIILIYLLVGKTDCLHKVIHEAGFFLCERQWNTDIQFKKTSVN